MPACLAATWGEGCGSLARRILAACAPCVAGAAGAAWVVLIALTGCGGGSDAPPAATAVASGQAVTRSIGPAGGSVRLSTREGATFTLTVPAGALKLATLLTMETAEATASRRFQLRLLPAGLVLDAGARATLELALPAAMQPGVRTTLLYDGVPMPVARASDGSLTLRLSSFARMPATSGPASADGLRTRPLAASLPACQGVPELGSLGEGTLTSSDAVDVEGYGLCMVGAVQALAANRQYDSAVRLANATAAYLQSIGSGDAGRFVREATAAACTAYREALDDALAVRVTALAQVHQLVRPILYWETAVQQLGARCAPTVGLTEYQDVINAKTVELVAVYAARKGAIVDVDGIAYTEAVTEARENEATVQQLQSLQPPAAVNRTVQQAIGQTAQAALLDAMLQAPWQRCRDSGDMARLMELMIIMNSPAPVQRAAQYCGTQLDARALAPDGRTLIASLTPGLGGGVAPASVASTGSMQIDPAGTLVLRGPIRPLACPAGTEGAPETLELRLNAQLLRTLVPGPYLASDLTIDLPDALRTAGMDPAAFSGASLSLHRTGRPCGGFWGDAPAPLLTLALEGGRSVVLVPTDEAVLGYTGAEAFVPEYRRLLEAVYGAGRVSVGSLAEGAALFRNGRDVVLVSASNTTQGIAFVAAQADTVRPWLEQGGHLLLHERGRAPGVAAPAPVTTPFGIGIYLPPPGDSHNDTYTVSWSGGLYSTVGIIAGTSSLDLPTSALAELRVEGFDTSLVRDDDQADDYVDNPVIFPVNYDNVGQGTAVAARRNVGKGRLLITTLAPPWPGFLRSADPMFLVVLRDLRGP